MKQYELHEWPYGNGPKTVVAIEDVEQLIAQHAQMLEALKVAISYHVRTYQEGQDDDEMIVYMALHAAIAAAEGGKA